MGKLELGFGTYFEAAFQLILVSRSPRLNVFVTLFELGGEVGLDRKHRIFVEPGASNDGRPSCR